MASHGIRDKVAIIGMGCTKFGEHWDKSADDMLIESSQAALADAGITLDDVDAFWLGTMGSGLSGLTLSRPLKIQHKPVTHVENFCATGSEAFRNACYAVASGAYDIAMAIGVEKLKDSGYSGLVVGSPANDGTSATVTAPASFSLLAPAYAKKYGVDDQELKDVLTRIAWKNHKNGALNPRAQFRKEVPMETIACSPIVAGPLGIFDCSGVSDGSAAAIIVRAEDAHKYCDNPLYVKALSFVAGPATGPIDPSYDYTSFDEVVHSATDAYAQAGITDPIAELAMAEVHDCFTPTELVLMEDMGFSPRGTAWKDVLAGRFDGDGAQPVNPDGGLKSFGHPIGASGLRMMYEMFLQLRGEAGARQIKNPKIGMTHNLGGAPGRCVSFVSLVGL
jgi:acetyl-CoA C-acetyltransferase